MKMKYVIFALLVTLLRALTYTDVITNNDNTCSKNPDNLPCINGLKNCNYNCEQDQETCDENSNGILKYCCQPIDKNGNGQVDCP